MRKLFYFALVLPMAMFIIACGESKKENPEADSLRNVVNSQLAEMDAAWQEMVKAIETLKK